MYSSVRVQVYCKKEKGKEAILIRACLFSIIEYIGMTKIEEKSDFLKMTIKLSPLNEK